MRILYLLNTYPRPSHSFVRREIAALERQGHHVVRLAMRRPPEPLAEAADMAERDRTRYALAPGAAWRLTRKLVGRGLRDPLGFGRALGLALRCGRAAGDTLKHLVYLAEAALVADLCRRERIAHVHAHFGTNPATVAMLARALGGPRYSFTVHGPEEFDRPEALCLGEKIARSSFCVAISSFGRSQLCRWADAADWPKIRVVHCGIEPARFPDPAPVPDGSGLNLVAIGRLAGQKGHPVLVEAMAQLRSRLPGLHLTVLGDGEMRGAFERAISDARLGDRIALAGWKDEAGVRAALADAHALVLPSFAEGLPVVAMEAMAAARPVIATWVAGIPELVQPGRTGWLVPAGDATALADAVLSLAGTARSDRIAMGMAGRRRVLERHDVDREACRLAAMFARPDSADAAPAPEQAPPAIRRADRDAA